MNLKVKVEVVWSDAFGGYQQLSELELIESEKLVCKSIGYLVAEDEQYIYLGFSVYPQHHTVKHWQVIPKSMIRSIKFLREA